jgi:hypothetical protein
MVIVVTIGESTVIVPALLELSTVPLGVALSGVSVTVTYRFVNLFAEPPTALA